MSSKLVMTFADANSDEVKFSYSYADKDASNTSIRQLVAGMITNGSIFTNAPVASKSAKIITTTEKEIDLSA